MGGLWKDFGLELVELTPFCREKIEALKGQGKAALRDDCGLALEPGKRKGIRWSQEILQWWGWHDLMMCVCYGMGKGEKVKEGGL